MARSVGDRQGLQERVEDGGTPRIAVRLDQADVLFGPNRNVICYDR